MSVLPIVEDAGTLDGVVTSLEQIDAALPEGDGLAWFNRLYLRMTRTVAGRVAAGDFANPAWMARLHVALARYYFEAISTWEQGGRPPGCWRALLERRGDCAATPIQFAMAGLNAHFNHDLPLALIDTFEATGIDPEHAGVQYADYTSMNATLAALIESAREEWNTPPAPAGVLAAWSLQAACEAAWTSAELLWGIRDNPLVAGRYMDVIDGLASVAGKALLVPAFNNPAT